MKEMKERLELSAPCLFGLESVLSFELKQLGADNVRADNGRVNFTGDESVLCRANLWLRTAERVHIVLGTFTALTFTELFDQVTVLPWEDYIAEQDAFPVKGWSIDSQLESVPSCQSIIKKAVVKRLDSVYHREIFPETGAIHQISFSIHKDTVTMMLDTTGQTLHKRGYRKNANLAPIRETLAAGICDLAHLRSDDIVYDPMCGSGTLLIEAAQRALNIAPGLKRSFDVEKWRISSGRIWQEERKKAIESIRHDVNFHGYGSDIDDSILQVAKDNARLAGVEQYLTFSRGDVAHFKPKAPATILCNPPYGERLMDKEEARGLYETMGNVMYKGKGLKYYIIGPQEEFEEPFGRKADKRRKLYNGMLPCQLYMYFR